MKIQLSDHFTYKKLFRFTLPSIVMMIVTSVYSVVDGLFVSNLMGDMALSAVNIVWPIIMIIGAFGFMLGTGGCAVVARTLGEGKKELANRYFSMIIYTVIILGALLSLLGIIFIEPLVRFAGASDLLIHDSVLYGRILLAGMAAFMLQTTFQSFFIVAERPHMGLVLSLAAGVTNMVLDYVFIRVFGMGVAGAALATILGYVVGGIIPFFYFLSSKRDGLRLVKTKFYGKVLLHSCTNGSSEMMNNVAASIVGMLFNIQLMRVIGESGVAAFAVMMYVDFIFLGTFFGFSVGSAPVISYHYGAGNHDELKNIFRKSMIITGSVSLAMLCISQMMAGTLCQIFVGYNPELMAMTLHGFRLFALNYVMSGINVYSSAFFTALCNGKISALLSFMRAFLLRGGMVLLLPLILGTDGIWLSVVVAEALGALLSVYFFVTKRKQYHYA